MKQERGWETERERWRRERERERERERDGGSERGALPAICIISFHSFREMEGYVQAPQAFC